MTKARGAWYERELERRRARRREARADQVCRWCGISLADRRRGQRYCSVPHQKAYLYRLAHPPRPPRPPRPVAPAIPDLERCDLVDAALDALRPYERAEIGSPMDAIGRDLVGEYVLAALEGREPSAAVAAARARYRHDRAALVHGLASVTGLTA